MTGISANTQERIENVLLELDLPTLDVSRMGKVELDAVLEKGYKDMLAGRTVPLAQAFDEIRRECGL